MKTPWKPAPKRYLLQMPYPTSLLARSGIILLLADDLEARMVRCPAV